MERRRVRGLAEGGLPTVLGDLKQESFRDSPDLELGIPAFGT